MPIDTDDIETTDSCWEWTGSLSAGGYSQLQIDGEKFYAHRISYRLFHGPIEPGRYVCHKCDNKKCINPMHLYAGLPEENTEDAMERGELKEYVADGNPAAKLTADEAKDAYERVQDGESQASVARDLGVTKSCIWTVVHGKTWASVTGADEDGG